MRKKIEYNLEYREDGEKKFFLFVIDFVCNWCIKEFNAVMAMAFDIQNKWDRISNINSIIASENGNKKKLKEEEQECLDYIIKYKDMDIVERRFAILKQILIDNGYKQEQFLNFDFWDRCVDPSTIIEFLGACIWKDIDKKKTSLKNPKEVFHEDRLLVALNKFWRPLENDFYWFKMDIPMTNDAIKVSQFTKEINDWIWEIERDPFEIY